MTPSAPTLAAVAWPVERAGQALEALARAARLPVSRALPSAARAPTEPGAWAAWVDDAARSLGLELALLHALHGQVERSLGGAAPALVEVALERGRAVVALLRVSRTGETAWVLAPDETLHALDYRTLSAAVRALVEWNQAPAAERVLGRAALPGAQRERARQALLAAQLANTHLVAARTLRLPPGARLLPHLRGMSAGRRLLSVLLLAVGVQGCGLAAWWLMGRGAFEGQLERGWLWAWALMLLTAVPLQAALAWVQGTLALDLTALLRRRLLAGALAMPLDEARRGGIGEYVGRTFESAGMEQLALAGSFTTLLALVDLALAGSVMAAGPAGGWGLVALAAFLAVMGVQVAGQSGRLRTWMQARVQMTHALIERLLGHRTRLAQEQPERWHDAEDQELAHYARASEAWDAGTARVLTLARRGLMPVALLATLPAVLAGASTAHLAVGVGAALLAARAVGALAVGALALVGARVLFASTRPILDAAPRPPPAEEDGAAPEASVALASARGPQAADTAQPLLEARDLAFRHPGAPRSVLDGASLVVREGERVLLEGPSGSGKSTLASILTGLREQDSGVVLLGGLDRATWTGPGWGAQIAAAPQFHENHVVSGTLAMNVLLGRSWPHSTPDVEEARALCVELGLGELLERMPSGMFQLVGERGWQLSHGEQSRVFVARALLQRVRVVVLDEAFGALDPVTLRKVMACVEARASTLVVIAHP